VNELTAKYVKSNGACPVCSDEVVGAEMISFEFPDWNLNMTQARQTFRCGFCGTIWDVFFDLDEVVIVE